MVADTEQRVAALPLLPDSEWQQVVETWNATAASFPNDACVHELVEAQVARAPDAVALVLEDEQLTYAALNARANQLAHELRTRGVGPDTRVALCLERSVELIVAIVGVLKAGGAYVPLTQLPPERLRFLLTDSAPVVVLTGRIGGSIRRRAPAGARAGSPTRRGRGSQRRADRRASGFPAHLAYVIYASGSAGRPRACWSSTATWRTWCTGMAAFAVRPGDRASCVAGVAFDATVGLWPTLCAEPALLPPGRT